MAVAAVIAGNGTVRHVPLEGGFYAIDGDDDRHYNPTNLPVEFRQDGITIRFSGRARDDMMSIRMYGTIIELDHVERR